MNYRQQELFLSRYALVGWVLSALCCAGTFALLNDARPTVTARDGLGFGILAVALSFGLYYVPKYLNLTIEHHKRYSWSIRIRWILAGMTAVSGLILCRTPREGVVMGAAVGLMALTNGVVRGLRKAASANPRTVHRTFPVIPMIYLAGDATALALPLWSGLVTPEGGVLLAALSIHFFVLVAGDRQLMFFPFGFLVMTAVLWRAGAGMPHLGILALWATTSLALTWLARERHRRNLEEVLVSLIQFTGETPEEVESLLLTSTGTLAANWHACPPKTSKELETWYRENAGYYIFDLSQFHLAYKHITFSLDVLSQARGRVLDYGAGIGDLALELASRGHDVTYFDVEGDSQGYARRRARERGLKVRFAAKREDLAVQYDTIILLDVLEHLPNPEETLEFLTKRLAPGGKLIASVAFGATHAHPMHFDHDLDVRAWLRGRGFEDAKSWKLRLFGSEAMRRKGVIIYRKIGV